MFYLFNATTISVLLIFIFVGIKRIFNYFDDKKFITSLEKVKEESKITDFDVQKNIHLLRVIIVSVLTWFIISVFFIILHLLGLY